MKPSILIIEDDPSIVLGLRINLSKAGYAVRTAADGQIGLAELAKERPDLVLLDLMLPGIDGLEILRQIRGQDETLPVVVLTALGAEDDKVRGLDLGANDYVTKPFSVAELVARVRATLRTASLGPSANGGDRLRAGSIELDRDRREVRVGDERVDLRGKEYDLLRFLMERPERVLTREQILTNVWGADYEGTDRTVDNFVSSLRRKLGEDQDRPRHLRTVWGIGYRFVP
jgi:two-component system, OmpR family, alkaline phosphatase synthesis response regulator PhoP